MKARRWLAPVLVAVLIMAVTAGLILALGGSEPTNLFAGKVGLVEVRGVIEDSEPVLEALNQFQMEKSVAAVVLRVDSPGGGVGASQEIYREIQKLAKVKPVVCSMGGLAASGGYYVAAPCTKIMANPGTLTGSIGVIASIPDMQKLFNKIGVRLQVVKSGALKGAGQLDRPLSPEQRSMLQKAISEAHEQFIRDVAEARKLPMEKVRAVADGGVFTGSRAKELGLVDRMGNFYDAVNWAAKLGGVTGRPKMVRPKDKSGGWWEQFIREQAGLIIKGVAGRLTPQGLMYLYHPDYQAR